MFGKRRDASDSGTARPQTAPENAPITTTRACELNGLDIGREVSVVHDAKLVRGTLVELNVNNTYGTVYHHITIVEGTWRMVLSVDADMEVTFYARVFP